MVALAVIALFALVIVAIAAIAIIQWARVRRQEIRALMEAEEREQINKIVDQAEEEFSSNDDFGVSFNDDSDDE